MPDQDLPRIFIGSSREGLVIAEAIQISLQNFAECTVWNQGTFQLGSSTLDNLYNFTEQFDLALFVASPDDIIEIRDATSTGVRDNVIFEFGLFMGALGTKRVVLVRPETDHDLHLPSDLNGLTTASYDSHRSDGNWQAAVVSACFQIRHHIRGVFEIDSYRSRTKKGGYAAAICFRPGEIEFEYLLIGTTAKRKFFPKGRIDIEKGAVWSAQKYARNEAGARGRIVDNVRREIKYFKEEKSEIQSLQFFLLEVTKSSQPKQRYAGEKTNVFDESQISLVERDPQWFNYEEALAQITSRRDYHTSYEIADTMEWSKAQIRKYLRRA
jgi:Predicted nucleotide-binding protein containing TIR-like domain